MNTLRVSTGDAKEHLSDYISRSAHGECRVVITRRGRPVAVIVSMKDLQKIEQAFKREGLSAVAGKWKGFEDIADDVTSARITGSSGRDVSL